MIGRLACHKKNEEDEVPEGCTTSGSSSSSYQYWSCNGKTGPEENSETSIEDNKTLRTSNVSNPVKRTVRFETHDTIMRFPRHQEEKPDEKTLLELERKAKERRAKLLIHHRKLRNTNRRVSELLTSITTFESTDDSLTNGSGAGGVETLMIPCRPKLQKTSSLRIRPTTCRPKLQKTSSLRIRPTTCTRDEKGDAESHTKVGTKTPKGRPAMQRASSLKICEKKRMTGYYSETCVKEVGYYSEPPIRVESKGLPSANSAPLDDSQIKITKARPTTKRASSLKTLSPVKIEGNDSETAPNTTAATTDKSEGEIKTTTKKRPTLQRTSSLGIVKPKKIADSPSPRRSMLRRGSSLKFFSEKTSNESSPSRPLLRRGSSLRLFSEKTEDKALKTRAPTPKRIEKPWSIRPSSRLRSTLRAHKPKTGNKNDSDSEPSRNDTSTSSSGILASEKSSTDDILIHPITNPAAKNEPRKTVRPIVKRSSSLSALYARKSPGRDRTRSVLSPTSEFSNLSSGAFAAASKLNCFKQQGKNEGSKVDKSMISFDVEGADDIGPNSGAVAGDGVYGVLYSTMTNIDEEDEGMRKKPHLNENSIAAVSGPPTNIEVRNRAPGAEGIVSLPVDTSTVTPTTSTTTTITTTKTTPERSTIQGDTSGSNYASTYYLSPSSTYSDTEMDRKAMMRCLPQQPQNDNTEVILRARFGGMALRKDDSASTLTTTRDMYSSRTISNSRSNVGGAAHASCVPALEVVDPTCMYTGVFSRYEDSYDDDPYYIYGDIDGDETASGTVESKMTLLNTTVTVTKPILYDI